MSARPDQRPMRALPVLEPRRAALETCAFCPKLCRSACPVSNAEPRETLTPWGKMTTAYLAALGDVPLTSSFASPAWACTGCRACRSACDHHNDVAGSLYAARGATAPLAPETARRALERFGANEEQAERAARTLPSSDRSDRSILVGCTYLRKALPEAESAVTAAGRLLGPLRVEASCCGMPLLMAGETNRFREHATRLAARIAAQRSIVVVDPGCAMTLRRHYAEAGVALAPNVALLVEEAARRIGSLRRTDEGKAVRYHDPCQLGRGLGVYEEPRAILTAITGRAPLEFDDRRERAGCSGAGGLLPVTMPELSRSIAAGRASQSGAVEIVTACASSLRSLRRANAVPVSDLATWLERATRA